MEKEIWKDVEGYEGCYQISNFGEVKSMERYVKHPLGGRMILRSRILKYHKNNRGYLIVDLCKDAVSSKFLIHRLVALAFIENRNEKAIAVNHMDGDKNNNKLSNLEWCTYSENTIHAYNLGLLKKNSEHYKSIFSISDVLKIRKLSKSGKTQQFIADLFKTKRCNISGIVTGKTYKLT